MTQRETGFLLIGLGIGLVFAAAEMIFIYVWFTHMFVQVSVRWYQGSLVLALPVVFVLVGVKLLNRGLRQEISN